MIKTTSHPVLKLVDEDESAGQIVPGGYLVSDDKLKRIGHGDIKRGRRWLRVLMAEVEDQKPIVGPTARPQTVRFAGQHDELALFDLLVMSYRENVSNIYPLAPERLIEDIQQGTEHREGGIIGVVDGAEGKPVACIVMAAAQWPASKAYFLREKYTFVHPDHRKSRHAEHLILFARWCSEEWSAKFGYPVYLGLSVGTTRDSSAKSRFFRRFANQIGASFLYPSAGVVS